MGYGLPPPTPSWGELLKQGVSNLRTAPWIVISTVTALVFTLTLVTFIGEAVREAFDPKNFQLMNKMKKLKHLNAFIVITAVIFFSSCENPKLKPPRENAPQDNKEQTGVDGIDREFARELAREFGREFAIEFARQLKGSNNPVNFDFSKDSNNTQSIEGHIVKEGKCTLYLLIVRRMFWNFIKSIRIVFRFYHR